MTFEQFQTTGRDSDDLGREVNAPDLDGMRGRIYAGDLTIVDRGQSLPFAGRWSAVIGNRSHHAADLADVERSLYEFAVAEGIA